MLGGLDKARACVSGQAAITTTTTKTLTRTKISRQTTKCLSMIVFLAFYVTNVDSFVPISRQSIAGKRSQVSILSPFLLSTPSPTRRRMHPIFASNRDKRDDDIYGYGGEEEEEDEDDEDLGLQDEDWRAFRAKLVMGESKSTTSDTPSYTYVDNDDGDLDGIGSVFQDTTTSSSSTSSTSTPYTSSSIDTSGLTPLDPSQWAYDSGDVIEKGAVILGGVEQEYGFGLRQQYFHKAAILVLDHDEVTFTKGIILNRPTDLMLYDDINKGVKWRVWYGGDVQGLESPNPDIVCLHSLKNKKAVKASLPVMKDIQWTTFENAKRLVKIGAAEVRDFWVFVGYAGWGPRQLKGELDRKSWYMVATDSQTLLKELARLAEGADPRDAGLDTWNLLMNMIGRRSTALKYAENFDDLMLKEWALKHLLSTEAGGGAGNKRRAPDDFGAFPELVDQLISRMAQEVKIEGINFDDDEKDKNGKKKNMLGAIVRASPAERSPFLLENQELHKALILIISDDENATVGVILNRPCAKGLDVQITDRVTGGSRSITIPLRFGGQYSVQGKEAMLWLHNSAVLRRAQVGSPIGEVEDGIWKCTAEDVMAAVGQEFASPKDFIVISGVTVWPKNNAVNEAGGIQSEIEAGKFEEIANSQTSAVWNALLRQEVLNTFNLMKNLDVAGEAWSCANTEQGSAWQSNNGPAPVAGIGQGFDEENDSFVFNSDMTVAKLSDEALRSWVAAFLLGAPGL